MSDIINRLRFDATRCEAQFSKGVAGNITEAADEIARLRGVLGELAQIIDWLDASPLSTPCESKCGYGKEGNADACYCGFAQWEAKRPKFLPAFRAGPILNTLDGTSPLSRPPVCPTCKKHVPSPCVARQNTVECPNLAMTSHHSNTEAG